MDTTANLGMPYIMAAQAQKHVTHNEALRALDAIVQLAVLDQNLTTPPLSPVDGDRHIVGAGAGGAWAGKDSQIAAYQDSAWAFYAPKEGWLAWVGDEDRIYAWDGAAWADATAGSHQNVPLLGVNTTADATNRLSVSSAATLLNHDGAGHQAKLNKAAAGDTASVMFQTAFSGRAEFGTTGDDDWHVKVSPDGAAWNEALIADKDTGAVRFPAGVEHGPSQAPVGQLMLTTGGDGAVSIYRNDVARGQNPRTAVISSVASDVITLTTTDAGLFFDDARMNGVVYLRIWNTSKGPEESAWVRASAANNQMTVTASGDISGWANGETVQAGDPTGITANRVMALDISPMMQALFGAVFRQAGVICSYSMVPATGLSQGIELSPTGAGDSFVGGASASDGSVLSGTMMIPCSQLSPVSGSNLLFVREADAGGQLAATRISSIAVIG